MENEDILKAKKLRIYPNKNQKRILSLWAHQNRYTYNMAIEQLNTGPQNKLRLRNMLVIEKNIPNDKKWLLETPKVIRQQAVFRACANFQAALTNGKPFSFKKKKSPMWTLGLEKYVNITASGKLTIFKNRPFQFGTLKIKDKLFRKQRHLKKDTPFENHKGILKPKHDCYISKDRFDRYYLVVPYTAEKPAQKPARITSLDPGLRKFLVGYSPDGESEYIGTDCRIRINELLKKHDWYNTLLGYEISSADRKRLLRKKRAVWRKLDGLKKELHDKTINYLTSNNGCIILGKLNTKEIVRRESRVLRAKDVRFLSRLSHYEFRTKLASTCLARGVDFILADESWTSKTCSGCGRVNKHLGGSEVYKCQHCDVKLDRDVNGARNILIKTLRCVNHRKT